MRFTYVPAVACVVAVITVVGGMLWGATANRWARYALRDVPDDVVREIGQHFVVAFQNEELAAELAQRGAIGGIYLGSENVAERSAAEVRAMVQRLQLLRKANSLPPLIVTADQEGGGVSRLSPPLPVPPALMTLRQLTGDLSVEAQQRAARLLGEEVGQGLCDLGVTMNLSPVVDLKSPQRLVGDARTQLHKRAVSDNPGEVIDLVKPYTEGLLSMGVRPVLKHFPGLGRVTVDTHLQPGVINAPLDLLKVSDWLPFHTLSRALPVGIMVGHVLVPAVDSELIATRSRKVVEGILRGRLQFDGLVITDDLTMWPTLFGPGGIGRASVDALNAGVDLLLITWKHDEYFAAFRSVLAAVQNGDIDREVLARSKERQRRALEGRCMP